MKTKVKIVMDGKNLARIDRAINQSMEELAKELDEEIKNAQVIPKQTGALEDSQHVTANGKHIQISYNVPYAKRLYYHPEYNFSRDVNPNAQGMWVKAVLKKENIVRRCARLLKEKIGSYVGRI